MFLLERPLRLLICILYGDDRFQSLCYFSKDSALLACGSLTEEQFTCPSRPLTELLSMVLRETM